MAFAGEMYERVAPPESDEEVEQPWNRWHVCPGDLPLSSSGTELRRKQSLLTHCGPPLCPFPLEHTEDVCVAGVLLYLSAL